MTSWRNWSITKTSCFFFSCYLKSDVDWLKTTIKIEMENRFCFIFIVWQKLVLVFQAPILLAWLCGLGESRRTMSQIMVALWLFSLDLQLISGSKQKWLTRRGRQTMQCWCNTLVSTGLEHWRTIRIIGTLACSHLEMSQSEWLVLHPLGVIVPWMWVMTYLSACLKF